MSQPKVNRIYQVVASADLFIKSYEEGQMFKAIDFAVRLSINNPTKKYYVKTEDSKKIEIKINDIN